MEVRHPHQTTSDSGGREGSGSQKKKIDEGQSVVVGVVDDDNINSYKGVLVKQQQEGDYSSSSSYRLDLGVAVAASSKTSALIVSGAGSEAGVVTQGKSFFTQAQRHELQHQALIFKHIVAGLSVPLHLALPIWKSMEGTVANPDGVLEFSAQEFDLGNMGDPESGRCRRTDGKRWRCGKNALPLEKYCEQHMHRGRNRSRKHVESLQSNPHQVELPYAKLDSQYRPSAESTPSEPRDASTMNSPVAKHDNSLRVVANTTTNCPDKDGDSYDATAAAIAASCPAIVASPASTTSADVTKAETDNGVSVSSNNADNKKDEKENNNTKNRVGTDYHIMIQCSEDKKHAYTSRVSNGISISAESVLPVSGCKYMNHIGSVELEMSRCRRTDGKKWRCKRDVLPQQKYCARHMHRGAKRHQEIPQLVTAAIRSTVATPSKRLPFTIGEPVSTNLQVSSPSTKLSMCISGRPRPVDEDDEKSDSSSDTDTTISDSISDYTNVAA